MIAYGLPSGSPTGSHPQCDYLPPPTHPKSGVAQKRGLFVGYRLPLPLQAHGSLHSWHFTPLRMACPIRSFGRVSDALFSVRYGPGTSTPVSPKAVSVVLRTTSGVFVAYGLPSGSPTGSRPQCDYLPPPTRPKSGLTLFFVGWRTDGALFPAHPQKVITRIL